MPSFGTASKARLATCKPNLVEICYEVIQHYDFIVLCGVRLKEAQNEAFRSGHSKLRWPDSRHNVLEEGQRSEAIDIAPYHMISPHIRWNNTREFVFLAGMMRQAAFHLGIPIRWGGNWDRDMNLYDLNRPFDLVHFELV